jgi:hypothetical protein
MPAYGLVWRIVSSILLRSVDRALRAGAAIVDAGTLAFGQ